MCIFTINKIKICEICRFCKFVKQYIDFHKFVNYNINITQQHLTGIAKQAVKRQIFTASVVFIVVVTIL